MAKYSEQLRQVQQQKLQQRLNPQSVALGRVLEMSVPEFEDEVRRELDENPALEVADSPVTDHDFGETSDQLQLADYADADDAPVYLRHAANASPDDYHEEAASFAADENDSMVDVLMRRLADENELSDTEMKIAAHIIGNLDDNGYLRRPLEAIADDMEMIEGFYVGMDEIEKVFNAVRALEPVGICAVDLRDCLLLQLDRKPESAARDNALTIVADYFDLFSKKHFDRIQNQMGLSRDDMTEALDLIKSLNPKPASALETGKNSARINAVTPDYYLDYDSENDRFSLSLPGNIPDLAIEASFGADEEAEMRDKAAAAFIHRRRNDALSFIRLVEQRHATLMSIGKAIVQLQRDFMLSGDRSDIKPMILKDVAAVTGLDLSVISRATSGKYIMTPHGMYPLKLFFNERPDADTDVSSHQILEKISALIDAEDKRHPLSDQAICEALAKDGFDIARRTVAKYRERLGLPVARLRRNF